MIVQTVTDYANQLSRLLTGTSISDRQGRNIPLDVGAMSVGEFILTIKNDNNKTMVIGNGGSAAIANHMQNDLCKAVGLRSLNLYEASLLTALANDNGYDSVFADQVKLWAERGDLLIAISSSGQSENIIKAVKAAEAQGCGIITFSGFKDNNPLRCLGDYNFYVPFSDYGLVESAHAVLVHYLTDCAQELQKNNYNFYSRKGDLLREIAEI